METWVLIVTSTAPIEDERILLDLYEIDIVVCDEPVSWHGEWFVGADVSYDS